MRYKIVSDGTVASTKLVELETGREIYGIRSIMWRIDAASDGRAATAVIELDSVALEVETTQCSFQPDTVRLRPSPVREGEG